MPVNSTTFTLNNGVKIPALGFGTFANEGAKGETYKAVKCALEVGYRHLDCAWFYHNENEVGDGIRDFLKENPSVKREDLFIVTKVWNHLHEPEDVKWSLENSLRNFGLTYIDLFMVHWPVAAERNDDYSVKIGADGKYVINKDLTENPEPTWRAMEELLASGKARSLGVSNWTIPGLKKLLGFAKVKPQKSNNHALIGRARPRWRARLGIVPGARTNLGRSCIIIRLNRYLRYLPDGYVHGCQD
ncbi:hypothetical protein NUW58_g3375 [Xylaria curta]|uniref:Uncharacterized protein n=1 Tax=Xylaria curta TaxID=42375 RepID=A0ACC1PCU9_9PEZI|nr:hypothetical protein NUW58_g3375 [Xylaria curta]